jgi:Sel1 repeat/Pentapeptide repeats (8 copies)
MRLVRMKYTLSRLRSICHVKSITSHSSRAAVGERAHHVWATYQHNTLTVLRKHADNGDIESQFTLGMMYARGTGVDEDYAESVDWFQKAADGGDATAQYNLARLIATGRGVKRDLATAAQWFRKAADAGDPDAQFDLATLHFNGKGVQLNYAEAAKLLLKAVTHNSSCHVPQNLGILYLEGKGLPRNHALAFRYFEESAKRGCSFAAENVAIMLERGLGVGLDRAQATYWRAKASELKVVKSQGPSTSLFTYLSSPPGEYSEDPYLKEKPWMWTRGNDPLTRQTRDDLERYLGEGGDHYLERVDLRLGELSYLVFKKARLEGAVLWGTQLRGTNFSEANLTRANLEGAYGSYEPDHPLDFSGADLTNARLSGARLSAVFRRTIFRHTDLAGADLQYSDFSGAVYEPKSNPDPGGMRFARGLGELEFDDPGPVYSLRDSMQKAGYKEEARWLNASIHRHNQSWFEYVLFDLTSEWGANWTRPLVIAACLSLLCAIVYWFGMHLHGRSGLYLVTTGQRIMTSGAKQRVLRLSASYLGSRRSATLRRRARAEIILFGTALLFSLMSVFNIGFRDFNFGRWIRMLQTREFDIRARGWMRTVSGVQSLVGVALAALALLSYFGQPFE